MAKSLYAAGAFESATPKAVTLQGEPNLIMAVSDARAVSGWGPGMFGWRIQGASLWETLPKEAEWTIAEIKTKA